MNLILLLLLVAVAWYLLSGLGTGQRVGGPDNRSSQDRDFRVRTAKSSTDDMGATMKRSTGLVQPEDARNEGGHPSVSASGSLHSSTQNHETMKMQKQGSNQDSQSGNRYQSSTYGYGEDSGALASMQDQAGADQEIKDWQTESLANLNESNGQSSTKGNESHSSQMSDQMTTGSQTGLTQEIDQLYGNSLYDGGLGSYEGTDLTNQTGTVGGMTNTTMTASGGTQEVNAYQPQLTGFSDATTTDENGHKVSSIQEKRQSKTNGKSKS